MEHDPTSKKEKRVTTPVSFPNHTAAAPSVAMAEETQGKP
jgi:hypothetical protein